MNKTTKLVIRNIEWIRSQSLEYFDDSDKADNLAGETILKCILHPQSFSDEADFKHWVVAVMSKVYVSIAERVCGGGYMYSYLTERSHEVARRLREQCEREREFIYSMFGKSTSRD